MKAAYTPTYGSPDIIEAREVLAPTVGDKDVLVAVHATAVTEGDRRLRSADFPGISAVFGRLAMGFFGPRRAIQGTMFAGRVMEIGISVTRYAVGDDVFGSAAAGAYAELLAMSEDGAMAVMPSGIRYEEAAAVPYGAGTAMHFLRDVAAVKSGEHVLVLGASGGVGRFAVQLAKHLGAEVTGVSSRVNFALVRELGADHVIDHRSTDFTQNGQQYDVILDIADATTFARSRSSLTDTGRYVSLYLSLGILFQMARTAAFGGPNAKMSIAIPSREDLQAIRDLVAQGVFTPRLAQSYPLECISDAHRAVDAGGLQGTVVVTVPQAVALRAVG
ncbi:MAG: NADPH:quinone reductase-like Zn-dependent oxidoreductase [Kiritimatiellia bacterium]|jgi:NADPH:quinone reductase-like Zn-dependent oxidoreductase